MTVTDNAGETLDNARDIGILTNTPQSFNDFVGDFNGLAYDSSDVYKFEITENSTVNLKVSGLSANANLYLLNKDGIQITNSTALENSDETITQNLIAGTYYIQVVDYSTSGTGTNYQLEAQATSLGTYVDNAGDTVETAKDIGILSNLTQTFTDYIGNFNGGTYGIPYDADDFYKFEVTENSKVNLKLSGLTEDANLWLYDDKGNLVDAANTSGNIDEVISKSLVSGTYYIKVEDYSRSGTGTSYQLEANAIPLSNYFDNAGNTLETAKDIGILSNTTQTFEDYIGNFNGGTYGIPADYTDIYKFEITDQYFPISWRILLNSFSCG